MGLQVGFSLQAPLKSVEGISLKVNKELPENEGSLFGALMIKTVVLLGSILGTL